MTERIPTVAIPVTANELATETRPSGRTVRVLILPLEVVTIGRVLVYPSIEPKFATSVLLDHNSS